MLNLLVSSSSVQGQTWAISWSQLTELKTGPVWGLVPQIGLLGQRLKLPHTLETDLS